MAEAEDFIVDAARHTTVFVRDLWRRNRVDATPAPVTLADLARRLDLLVSAVHGESLPLRVAQPPPPPTLLERLFRRALFPRAAQASTAARRFCSSRLGRAYQSAAQ